MMISLTGWISLWIGTLIILVSGWSVWRGLQKTRFKFLLVLLHCGVAFFLWALLVDLSWQRESPNTVRLLTPGAARNSESSQNPWVYWNNHNESDGISHLAELTVEFPDLNRIEVLGDGLALDVFREHAAYQIVADQDKPLLSGFSQVNWPEQSKSGEVIQVSGQVVSADHELKEIRLVTDINNPLIIATAVPDNLGYFALDFQNKTQGRYLFRLQVLDAESQVQFDEPLAGNVEEQPGLEILMLLSRPGFESGQLKRWLVDAGANVQASTNLAPGIERVDSEAQTGDAQVLSESYLSAFDLLIIDSTRLSLFDPTELQTVMDAVNQGLGVLLLPDEMLSKLTEHPLLKRFDIAILNNTDSLKLNFADEGVVVPVTTAAFEIRNKGRNELMQGFATDSGDTLLAAFSYGLGRVGLFSLLDSYLISRIGSLQIYAQFWQSALNQLSRSEHSSLWVVSDRRPVVGKRLTLCSDENSPLTVNPNEKVLLVQRDYLQASCVDVWAEQAGWYRIGNSDQQRDVYVYSDSDWDTANRLKVRQETIQAQYLAHATSAIPARLKQPAHWLWWSLLIICWSGLWLERKFRSTVS